MRKLLLPGILLCCLLAGCTDSRIKRATSLSVVKVQVAKSEFKNAKTPEEKVKVAGEYFDSAEPLLKAVDDYTHGREPKEDPANPPR